MTRNTVSLRGRSSAAIQQNRTIEEKRLRIMLRNMGIVFEDEEKVINSLYERALNEYQGNFDKLYELPRIDMEHVNNNPALYRLTEIQKRIFTEEVSNLAGGQI